MCKGERFKEEKVDKFCLYTKISISNDRVFKCGVDGEVFWVVWSCVGLRKDEITIWVAG